MERRGQVFVSSTYRDLRKERAKVSEALLQLDCFPAGMELFPAADEDSWSLIKQVIDDSDYYLVILAGRYGDLKSGSVKSFTHLEYEYAMAAGKPTIALLHGDPGQLVRDNTESSEEGRKALEEFRVELQKKNCRLWIDDSQLVAAVFTGIQHLKKSRPAVGWIKGSEASDASLKDELIKLRRKTETLAAELEEARERLEPRETSDLAQGSDGVTISVSIQGPEQSNQQYSAFLSWQEILRAILPNTLGGGAEEERIAGALADLVRENLVPRPQGAVTISASDFGKVMNQMVALGLVEARPHPEKRAASLWVATLYGAQAGARMLALRRSAS